MSSCSFNRKKFHFHGREPAVVNTGCNCGPKLKFFFTSLFSSSSSDSSSKRSNSNSTATSNSPSTAYSWDPVTATSHYEETAPSPLLLPHSDETTRSARRRRSRRRRKKEATSAADGEGRVARESVAVVKETTEPYMAFKESMVQMIVEKDMYGWDDLNDLLSRFLVLNSPCHHRLIFRAFADIWEDTTVATSSASGAVEDHNYVPVASATASPSPYNYYYYY